MWFEKRRYGWGWHPLTWQGWTIFFSALIALIMASWLIEDVTVFIIVLVAIASALGSVSWYFSVDRHRR